MIFALGDWAGYQVSDVSYLLMKHVHVTSKAGWLHVGHKGGKWRDIDLVNEARRPLYVHLAAGAGKQREPKHKQNTTSSGKTVLPVVQPLHIGLNRNVDRLRYQYMQMHKTLW